MKYALWGLALVGGLGGLYCLHRIALWAEQRGWVYYRDRRGSGTLGNAFLEVQAIIEPSKRYVLEERLEDEHETQESGDPPAKRNRSSGSATAQVE